MVVSFVKVVIYLLAGAMIYKFYLLLKPDIAKWIKKDDKSFKDILQWFLIESEEHQNEK